MTDTLVDTNVILDVVQNDTKWADWSLAALETAAARDALAIDDIRRDDRMGTDR